MNKNIPSNNNCMTLAAGTRLLKHLCLFFSKTKPLGKLLTNTWRAFYLSESIYRYIYTFYPLEWRNKKRDGVSNPRHVGCLLNRLFRRRSKKRSNLRVTGLCEGNSTVTGKFPSPRDSNAENGVIMHFSALRRNMKLKFFPYRKQGSIYLTRALPWLRTPCSWSSSLEILRLRLKKT